MKLINDPLTDFSFISSSPNKDKTASSVYIQLKT